MQPVPSKLRDALLGQPEVCIHQTEEAWRVLSQFFTCGDNLAEAATDFERAVTLNSLGYLGAVALCCGTCPAALLREEALKAGSLFCVS